MSLLKIPVKNPLKSRRTPNAFMLYVKEQKKELLKKCPEENKSMIGAFLGEKWRSLRKDEKQVYYDKYNALRKLDFDNSVITMKIDKQPGTIDSQLLEEISNINSNSTVETQRSKKSRRKSDEFSSSDEFEPKKFKGEDEIASTSKKDSLVPFFKPKAKKKIRRPPNPFMIFAKEQRTKLPPSYTKEKKFHTSTILGAMWRELPDAERSKYIEAAKRQHDLQKLESAISSAKPKKNPAKKSVGRPAKKSKELVAAHLPILRSMTNEDPGKKVEASTSNSNHPSALDNAQSNNGTNGYPESQVTTDFSNASYLQTNGSISHFHHLPPAIDSHQSKNCFCWNSLHADRKSSDVNMRQYPLSDGAMARSCAGAGFFPPFFMPYPVSNAHFWMYQQMIQQMYLQNFSQPYCCNFPYNYYRNTYFNSYFPPRNNSAYFQPTFSAASGNPSNRGESAESLANGGNSDEELLVVDDRLDQPPMNGEHHQE